MRTIRIPPQLAEAVEEDDYPERLDWLAALPSVVDEIASDWQLELGEPYLPGGQCAWVAPARTGTDDKLVLKVGWRHREAEHEADALRLWDGDGAIRCLAARSLEDTTALLLERCAPGHRLSRLPEPEQDEIIAGLLPRLWAHAAPPGHPFASLEEMCGLWADWFELDPERVRLWLFARCAQESLHDVTMREAARPLASVGRRAVTALLAAHTKTPR